MKIKDIVFPAMPYLEIKIGDKVFNCMDYMFSADIEISGDLSLALGGAVLTVYDSSALEVEKAIQTIDTMNNQIKFAYGWIDSAGQIFAEKYTGYIIGYSINLKPEGLSLTVSTLLYSTAALIKQDKQRSHNGEISEIVEKIAKEYGLTPDVDKTNIKGNFLQLNQNDLLFIEKVLLQKANSASSDNPYAFWIEEDKLYFKQLKDVKTSYRFVFPADLSDDVTSVITDLAVQTNFIGGLLVGEDITVKKIDPFYKKEVQENISNESTKKRVGSGAGKNVKSTGSSRVRVAPHGIDIQEEVARWKQMWGKLVDQKTSIEITVLGNPFVKPKTMAEVLIYLTDWKTKEMFLHHTSGVYQVEKIRHSISPGRFHTVLSMSKNTEKYGNVEFKGAKLVQ